MGGKPLLARADKSRTYQPRLCILVTEEQMRRLNRLNLAYGLKSGLFRVVIDDLLDALEKNPKEVLGGVLSRDIKLVDYLKISS